MFPIKNDLKQGDVLLPMLFKFSVEYAIRGGGSSKAGWLEIKWNISVFGLCWWCWYIGRNREASVVAGKETGLEVNADKTKYVVEKFNLLARELIF